jgi:hypothetical protein
MQKKNPLRSKTYCEKNLGDRCRNSPRSAAPGGCLLPFDLLPLAAVCFPSICCPWRLDVATRSAPGGWLLPFDVRVKVEVARYFRHSVDGRTQTRPPRILHHLRVLDPKP